MVRLEGEDILAAGLANGLGNGRIGRDRIDRDQRPVQAHARQQIEHGGAFVGLAVDGALGEHKPLGGRPGADQVACALTARRVGTGTQGLAVQGDDVGGI